MIVNSPETFETAAAQYRKFRYRRRIAYWMFWVFYGSLGPVAFLITGGRSGELISFPYWWSLAIPALGAALFGFLRVRYRKLAKEALPSEEAKSLFFLQPAITNLANFIQHGSRSYKKECLKHLTETADVIDNWSVGNMRFLQKQFEGKLKDFKKAFRLRLIPAVKEANSEAARNLHGFLAPMQNKLIFGVDGVSFDAWNSFLSEFKETSPKQSKLKRLASKTLIYHGAYFISAVFVAYEYFGFLRNSVGTDVNTATTGANVVLGILLTPYAAYLFWKYIYREKRT